MPQHRDDVAAAVHDMQNEHHIVFHDAVDDDVIISREAAQAGT